MRSKDFATKLHARDLGGHIQYSQVVSNSTITNRCAQIKPLWGRLSRSLSPYRTKIRAIKAKAWPHCLHGVASVHMSDDHFTHLRTGAMQGLGEHSAGTSPIIHMSLVEHPSLDPQFAALWSTVLNFRRQPSSDHDFDFAMQQLHVPMRTHVPKPGPHSVLLVRLHQVAWQWFQGTLFKDQQGMLCDVIHCCVQEAFSRLVRAWQSRAQALGGSRKTMQGLELMSPSLTMQAMTKHSPEEQALLRASLNGTFFTADRQRHHDGTDNPDGLCRFCNRPDSPLHRHLECPAFATCRTLTQQQLATLAAMPSCVGSHGWVPEPPSLVPFRKACLEVQDHLQPFELPPTIPDTLYVFTDGACERPGVLPGWTQTSLRAEILAAIKACHLALEVNRPLQLWTDNALVYKRIQAFRNAFVDLRPTLKDSDLWSELQFVVRPLGPQLTHVGKVVSHQCLHRAVDEYESWVFRGNSAADAAASAVYCTSTMLPLWQQLRQDVSDVTKLRDQLHTMLIRIGKTVTRDSQPAARADVATWQPRIREADVQEVQFPLITQDELGDKFHFDGVDRLLQWLPTVCHSSEDVQFISWFQLNMLYEYQTGTKGFVYNCQKRQWKAAPSSHQADFARRTNWLSKIIRNVMDEVGQECQALHLRPKSQVVLFWTMTIPIRMKRENWNLCEQLMADQQVQLRSVAAVRGLSYNTAIAQWEPIASAQLRRRTQRKGEKGCLLFVVVLCLLPIGWVV